MKKCLLINCFASSNENRVEPIRKWFLDKGFETKYYSSNFHHAKKLFVSLPDYVIPVNTVPYKKNISIKRLISHINFSRKIYKILLKEKPDVLYVKFPPNSLIKYAAKYKKKNQCHLIFDIFDLWPESLPISNLKKKIIKPFLSLWSAPRNKNLNKADLVFAECNMYRDALSNYLPKNVETLYLSKIDIPSSKYHGTVSTCFFENKNDCISMCYLGSINNLIDIKTIGRVINSFSRYQKVRLEIIGDGANREKLIEIAKINGAEVSYHGIVFDEEEKQKIMSSCDFGLNIMKETVKVALTIKSIDYFRAGLAVLNNIHFDTWDIIEESCCGMNINDDFFKNFTVFSRKEIESAKNKSRDVFLKYFSDDVFCSNLNRCLSRLLDM